MKGRRRSTAKPKARKAPTVHVSIADLQEQLERRTRERDEALEQQTATADVLKVISSSPGELEPVFQAMLANAVRICGANFGVLFRYSDEAWRADATYNVPPAFAEFWQRGPQRPSARTGLGRISATKQTIHIADVTKEPAYIEGEAVFVAAVNLGGFRAVVNVPMLKENQLIGCFAVYRQEVRPFTDKQIELVQNFAAQAVIAIENARLLNELRESLQQQTATADVLKVISRSGARAVSTRAGMRSSSLRSEVRKAFIFERDGELYRLAANYVFLASLRVSPNKTQSRRGVEQPPDAWRGGRTVQIPDLFGRS